MGVVKRISDMEQRLRVQNSCNDIFNPTLRMAVTISEAWRSVAFKSSNKSLCRPIWDVFNTSCQLFRITETGSCRIGGISSPTFSLFRCNHYSNCSRCWSWWQFVQSLRGVYLRQCPGKLNTHHHEARHREAYISSWWLRSKVLRRSLSKSFIAFLYHLSSLINSLLSPRTSQITFAKNDRLRNWSSWAKLLKW